MICDQNTLIAKKDFTPKTTQTTEQQQYNESIRFIKTFYQTQIEQKLIRFAQIKIHNA